MREPGNGSGNGAESGGELPVFSSQEFFMQVAEGRASIADIPHIEHTPKAPAKHVASKPAKKAVAKQKSAAD
jgi:hypothetical protein